MVVTSIEFPVQRRRRGIVRLITALLALLAVVVLAVGVWFFVAAQAALPQLDGTVALPGINGRVTIIRDAQGVPNISASDLNDLFFAQGYVTAQDRLWQMDMTRRFAAGELAEVLGSKYVEHDRLQRTLLIRPAAEAAAAQLSPRDRAYFAAYARGVNAYIEHHSLPLEFRVLRYRPRPWTVTDSFLVAASMAEALNLETLSHELARERISARLPPDLAADLYRNASWRDHPPGADTGFGDIAPAEANPATPQLEPTPARAKPGRALIKRRSASRPGKQRRRRHHRATQGRQRARRKVHAERSAQVGLPQHRKALFGAKRRNALVPTRDLLPSSAFALPFDRSPLIPGSNNWVISGAHTISGKPLLANDMHLRHQIPNVWYEAHLTSGDYDVAGVTLPGLPFVVAGHNQRIAWGFTNLGPAVADLYIEQFNQRGEYLTPDGWRQPQHRHELIRVKHGLNRWIDVVITRHGPIVSGVQLPSGVLTGDAGTFDRTRQLALRWTLYDPATMQVPLFDMNSARNWDEFRLALSHFGNPAQNVVYADVDGHIGYQAAGMVPIRPSPPHPADAAPASAAPSSGTDPNASAAPNSSTDTSAGAEPSPADPAWTGAIPVEGSDNAHEWTGYIPFAQLPSVFDPPSGIIATANGRITTDGFPYLISNEWGPPYRTERIYRVLSADKKFSAADMLALQNDVYSDFDRFCAQRFVYAVDHAPSASARSRQAAEMMRAWDGRETSDSAAATITAKVREQVVKMVLVPKLGEMSDDYRWFMSSVWLEDLLLQEPARWLPAQYASWDDLLAAAVETAVNAPGAPSKLDDWRWGRQNLLAIRHPIFGSLPGLKSRAGTGTVEQSGNGYTVKQVGPGFGPSERMTVDLADLDNSTLNLVNGQSGQLFSEYFNGQWRAYLEGRSFPLAFSPTAVSKAKVHELVLVPGR